ncbi:MAG: dihydroneopterin aldolase [Prevotellaceae bacterium]|nr:dihydroneopterin aldolase [Prevotellaceae bacterium]
MRIEQAEISLNDIKVYAYHGVLPQERLRGAFYLVSLHCQISSPDEVINCVSASDNVADTINYADLCSIVNEEMAQPSNLIETVTSRIGRRIIKAYAAIARLQVTVKKLTPPVDADCANAAVTLTFVQ